MKILAFSDLHRDVAATHKIIEAATEADIVVGAGDYATRCEGLIDCIELLGEVKAPVVLVPGNHDRLDELRSLCDAYKNFHILHGETANLFGKEFVGLGLEIPSRNDEAWNQTMPEADAARFLERCPENAVLVTHTPPMGCADMQRDGTHEGSQAIAEALITRRPALHLCGHIHNSWGASGMVGDTFVKNLGPSANWFEI